MPLVYPRLRFAKHAERRQVKGTEYILMLPETHVTTVIWK